VARASRAGAATRPARSLSPRQAVALTVPFPLAPRTLRHLLEPASGRIVSIGSVEGLVDSPHRPACVAPEHGVVGLTKTIALEAAAASPDVTAHAVCRSYASTPLVGAQLDTRGARRARRAEAIVADMLLGRNTLKRSIQDEHVAKLVASVCGPGAWATTGAASPMGGGWAAN
jgi:3-hydroxybutyrate dehydrogenase